MLRNRGLKAANRSERAVPYCRRVDLLMFRNSVFTVRKVIVWAVMSSNEGDLLMFTNSCFMVRNVEICGVV